MSLLGVFIQQPADTDNYTIDYVDALDIGDTVASAIVAVAPVGLTVPAPTVTSPRVILWASTGVNNTDYVVTVTSTMTSGRILQDEFKVKVREL